MSYDYIEGKKRIQSILNNYTTVNETDAVPSDDNFTFDNSYYSVVTALFVDIRDSSVLFANSDKVMVSKIIRSFTSEIIEILRHDENLREIGIRGDCVYSVFSTPYISDISNIADYAVLINTEIKMLNKLLAEKGYKTINIGIGISTDKELIVKAGRKYSGINSKVWIGEAVTMAANLSSIGNKGYRYPIVFSSCTYDNIIEKWTNDDANSPSWFHREYSSDFGTYYHANIVKTYWSEWIDKGMPE